MAMPILQLCQDCGEPMSAEDIEFYEYRCDRCEKIWFYTPGSADEKFAPAIPQTIN